MKYPRICVAGVDVETRAHVRPVRTAQDPLTVDDTADKGGLFALGNIVDLGEVTPRGTPPETEDCGYDPGAATHAGSVGEDELWSKLRATSCARLIEIFGPELGEIGDTFAVNEGRGSASLGCLSVRPPLDLYVGLKGTRRSARLALHIDCRDRDLPVTDLRLFLPDFSAPDDEAVHTLNSQLKSADEILLAVGLTRPYPPDREVKRHWLQVNTIYCR